MLSSLLAYTSYSNQKPAKLVLEDGSVFEGVACAADGEVFGEVCFNTSLEGYLEVISDPSYAGQIITMTYPQIGNYGVSLDDLQSDKLALRGLVVHSLCTTPSNWRSTESLSDFLTERNVVAISGIDTRALTMHLRENGAQRGVISTLDLSNESLLSKVRASQSIVGINLAQTVSRNLIEPYNDLPASHEFACLSASKPSYNVVVYDCGIKKSILHGLIRVGCNLTLVPWNTPYQKVLEMQPDGVFLSNGPGDPDAVEETYLQVKELIGKVPLFGICLGHQMISLAAGATISKLKYGHRGGNQPVMNLRTRRVEITAQNHGFGLEFPSLGSLIPELSGGVVDHPDSLSYWVEHQIAPVVENSQFGRIQLTHVNLNDFTAEGIAFLDYPVFSVQYHPEANPGPTDSHYLFSAFVRLMDQDEHYLDIDIAKDRLAGWVFDTTKGAHHA